MPPMPLREKPMTKRPERRPALLDMLLPPFMWRLTLLMRWPMR